MTTGEWCWERQRRGNGGRSQRERNVDSRRGQPEGGQEE